jgi:hypothetical protein
MGLIATGSSSPLPAFAVPEYFAHSALRFGPFRHV